MRYVLFMFIAVSVVYTQDCNANNWQQYSPNLEYCDLENANIAWMDVSDFNFFGANLTNANLTGSNFSGSNLTNAILIDADLTWTTFIGSNLTDANLSGAGLGAADFTDANLSGAILYGVILFDTNFSNACIEDTYGFPVSGYIGEPIEEGCSTPNTVPDWSFDPFEFEHVMSITARVFDGSEDTGWESDIVGAFSGGECVGVAEAAEVPPFLGGGYAFLIQVYSHSDSGNVIEFQFYSEADNMIYNISETILFASDEIIGDLNNAFNLSIANSNNNTMPIAESATYTLDEDNMITILLSASDADGDSLSFIINDHPNNGALTLSGSAATYIPNINYNGMDVFTFIANDGQSNSNIGTINLVVNAVNDAPNISPIADSQVQYGQAFIYSLVANDVDGDDLYYSVSSISGDGTATISDNILTVIGNSPNSVLMISVTVSDGMTTDQTSFQLIVLDEPCAEEYDQGFWDGAATGDVNGDGELNVVDIVYSVNMILNGD